MNLSSLPTVCLVRHGETAWTISGQHTGHTDIPLTEEGERSAKKLGTKLHYGVYEGRRTSEIRADPPGWKLFEDGCDILRVLVARWLGMATREGRCFYLGSRPCDD